MQYGTHPNDIAHFRLLTPGGSSPLIGLSFSRNNQVTVNLSQLEQGTIQSIIEALDNKIVTSTDWTSSDIAKYFLKDATFIGHVHDNKPTLDQIKTSGSGNIITQAERDKLAGIETGATADQTAAEVPYDNDESSLTSDNVQDALDEVAEKIDVLSAGGNIGNTIYAFYTSADIISSGKAVKLIENEQVSLASNDDVTAINEVIGIAAEDKVSGQTIKIARNGYLQNNSWNWTPHKNIFVDLNGDLSQIYMKRSYSQIIARAISETEVNINILRPIT